MEFKLLSLPRCEQQAQISVGQLSDLIQYVFSDDEQQVPEFHPDELAVNAIVDLKHFSQPKAKLPAISKKYFISPNKLCSLIVLATDQLLLINSVSQKCFLVSENGAAELPPLSQLKKLFKFQKKFDFAAQQETIVTAAVSDFGDVFLQFAQSSAIFDIVDVKVRRLQAFQATRQTKSVCALFVPKSCDALQRDTTLVVSRCVAKSEMLIVETVVFDGFQFQEQFSHQLEPVENAPVSSFVAPNGRAVVVQQGELVFSIPLREQNAQAEYDPKLVQKIGRTAYQDDNRYQHVVKPESIAKSCHSQQIQTDDYESVGISTSADGNVTAILFKKFAVVIRHPMILSAVKLPYQSDETGILVENRTIVVKTAKNGYSSYGVNVIQDRLGLVERPDRFCTQTINLTILQNLTANLGQIPQSSLCQAIRFCCDIVSQSQLAALSGSNLQVTQRLNVDELCAPLIMQLITKFCQNQSDRDLDEIIVLANSYCDNPLMEIVVKQLHQHVTESFTKYNIQYFRQVMQSYSATWLSKQNTMEILNQATKVNMATDQLSKMSKRGFRTIDPELVKIACFLFAFSFDIARVRDVQIDEVSYHCYQRCLKFLLYNPIENLPQLPSILLLSIKQTLAFQDVQPEFKPVKSDLDHFFDTLIATYSYMLYSNDVQSFNEHNDAIHEYKKQLIVGNKSIDMNQLKFADSNSPVYEYYLRQLITQHQDQKAFDIILDDDSLKKLKISCQLLREGSYAPLQLNLCQLSQELISGDDFVGYSDKMQASEFQTLLKQSNISGPAARCIIDENPSNFVQNIVQLSRFDIRLALKYSDYCVRQLELLEMNGQEVKRLKQDVILLRSLMRENLHLLIGSEEGAPSQAPIQQVSSPQLVQQKSLKQSQLLKSRIEQEPVKQELQKSFVNKSKISDKKNDEQISQTIQRQFEKQSSKSIVVQPVEAQPEAITKSQVQLQQNQIQQPIDQSVNMSKVATSQLKSRVLQQSEVNELRESQLSQIPTQLLQSSHQGYNIAKPVEIKRIRVSDISKSSVVQTKTDQNDNGIIRASRLTTQQNSVYAQPIQRSQYTQQFVQSQVQQKVCQPTVEIVTFDHHAPKQPTVIQQLKQPEILQPKYQSAPPPAMSQYQSKVINIQQPQTGRVPIQLVSYQNPQAQYQSLQYQIPQYQTQQYQMQQMPPFYSQTAYQPQMPLNSQIPMNSTNNGRFPQATQTQITVPQYSFQQPIIQQPIQVQQPQLYQPVLSQNFAKPEQQSLSVQVNQPDRKIVEQIPDGYQKQSLNASTKQTEPEVQQLTAKPYNVFYANKTFKVPKRQNYDDIDVAIGPRHRDEPGLLQDVEKQKPTDEFIDDSVAKILGKLGVEQREPRPTAPSVSLNTQYDLSQQQYSQQYRANDSQQYNQQKNSFQPRAVEPQSAKQFAPMQPKIVEMKGPVEMASSVVNLPTRSYKFEPFKPLKDEIVDDQPYDLQREPSDDVLKEIDELMKKAKRNQEAVSSVRANSQYTEQKQMATASDGLGLTDALDLFK